MYGQASGWNDRIVVMESITCRTSTDALAPRRRRLVGGAGCCDRVALAFRGSCAGNRDPSSTIASIIVISPLTRLHSRDVPLKIACSLGDNTNTIRLRRIQRPAAVQTPTLPVIYVLSLVRRLPDARRLRHQREASALLRF
jgi:hypothetical protein